MEFTSVKEEQWPQIREIYLEAFPKRERKPYLALRHSAKKKKALVMTATEGGQLLGFTVLIPYRDMVMVDYLAVSSRIRSKGTGSYIMAQVCKHFAGQKIVLLIERLDDGADNREQRISRRSFYVKNGFTSSGLFISGASGEMEIMNYGGTVSREDYMSLQKYALGNLFFTLSNIRILDEAEP
ncbi:GNAT family N-acetyltransferase [Intestinimonas sp.]|uniref:GNAT family N-acetyltransferase n=1 Tax=Intestinimonas sp. TaxID=1965293 RepID=UPI00261D68A1|nr:GNAT family N-acetyltransferase [Intestinimonas sp.]